MLRYDATQSTASSSTCWRFRVAVDVGLPLLHVFALLELLYSPSPW